MRPVVSLFVLLMGSAPAFAQEKPPQDEYADHLGIGAGPFKVTGSFKIEEWYDDNVTLSPSDELDDLLTVLIPELNLRHEGAQHDARFNYLGRDLIYTDNSDFNGMEHYLDLLGRYRTGRFRGEAGADYKQRKEPYDTVQFTGRFTSHTTRAWATGAAEFNMMDVEVTVEALRFDAKGSTFNHSDFDRVGVSGLVAYDAWPKTQAYFETAYAATDYDEDEILNSFDYLRISVGLRGDPTETLSVNARVGWSLADPEDEAVNQSEEISGIDVLIAAKWKTDEKGSLAVDFIHRPVESAFSGLQMLTRLRAVFDREVIERLTFNAEASAELQDESEGGADRSGIDGKFSLVYVPGTNLKFDFGLQFRSKESDDSALEYDNFRTWLGGRINW